MRSSPEAERRVTPSGAARGFFFAHGLFACFLLCLTSLFVGLTLAFAQGDSQPTAAPNAGPQAESKQSVAEVASHDEPTTFRVNVKLVVVRAVVRDSQGHLIFTGQFTASDLNVPPNQGPGASTYEATESGLGVLIARRGIQPNVHGFTFDTGQHPQ